VQGPETVILRVHGGVAQLGELLLCTQRVVGSSPITSTIFQIRKPGTGIG
jgi:hypothetical protein